MKDMVPSATRADHPDPSSNTAAPDPGIVGG